MELLSYKRLKELGYDDAKNRDVPEKILQFGEGNFLRGFVEDFVDQLNQKTDFCGKIVMVQPIMQGSSDKINAQDCLYTLYLRGIQDGRKINERRIIQSVQRCIDPYREWESFLECAKNEELEFIVTNTTEQGIRYDPACEFGDCPQSSFPGKLTRFLYERFLVTAGDLEKGFQILSCELIENNGTELKKCVLAYAKQWGLSQKFIRWIEEANTFCNTLVDRIVTGYPMGESERLNRENGYEDKLIDTAEVFGFWVIEGPESLNEKLKLDEVNLPIHICRDHIPYKKRKVRILNGAHTSMVMAAYLMGYEIVRDCMEDGLICRYVEEFLSTEVIPTIDLPREDLQNFSIAVIERFKNPFIDHRLLAISLNSVSKWRTRVLPTVLEFQKRFGYVPLIAVFSFAALLQFYRGDLIMEGKIRAYREGTPYYVCDSEDILGFFSQNSSKSMEDYAYQIAKSSWLWGRDLSLIPGFLPLVVKSLEKICDRGMRGAMDWILENKQRE